MLDYLLSIDINYVIIGVIAFFFTLEQIFSNQFKFTHRGKHLFNNILFQLTISTVNVFFASLMVYAIEWLNNNEIGLLHYITIPFWAKLLLSVILFDFGTYWFHRLSHRIPLVWQFHRIHHSDTSVDSSTFLRFHPVDLVFWFGTGYIATAAVFGLELTGLGLYFLIATPMFFLEHTNLRFPGWLDRTLGLVFTTPNLHKIHHEQDQLYTDSNYADIFILWDRIFGTYKYKPAEQIKFGLIEFEEEKRQSFGFLMISPFIRIRKTSSEGIKNIEAKPTESEIVDDL
jgi:sterol desaturase/sphingolipid hydroxylase (fatty acid hydroxylase superfamily)